MRTFGIMTVMVGVVMVVMLGVSRPVLGDIPSLQLDGTYSKESPYQDDYPYAPRDFQKAAQNPLGLGILRRVGVGSPDYETLAKKIAEHDYKVVQAEMTAKYAKEVTAEFDLTEAEKEVVRQHPGEFPKAYAETGKRSITAQILLWAGKELPRSGCSFVGEADFTGSGQKCLVLDYWPPVTYRSYVTWQVFNASGELVLNNYFPEIDFAGRTIADIDGDGRDELLALVSGGNKEIWVVGVPQNSSTSEPLPGDSGKLSSKGISESLSPSPGIGPAPRPSFRKATPIGDGD